MEMTEEEIINEWTRRSRKEGHCGIVNCYNKPTTKCNKHFESHIDIIDDSKLENQERGNKSLDYFQ
jgi:hypothetical protein